MQIYVASSITKPASPVARINGTEFVYPAASGEGKGTIKYFWLEAVDFSGNVSTTVGPEYENILIPRADEIDGDVGEVLNVGILKAPAVTLSSSETTFGEFTIPAPDPATNKYAVFVGICHFTSNNPSNAYALEIDFERKSTGITNGTSLGAIVASGTLAQYYYWVEVAGNKMKEVDHFGGIATSETSPSAVRNPYVAEYQSATDRTRIIYGDTTERFTSGTLYYNPDRWTSSGTWLTDTTGVRRYPIANTSGVLFATVTLHQPLAQSDDEQTYRVRMRTSGFSGTSVNASSISGQVQLLT